MSSTNSQENCPPVDLQQLNRVLRHKLRNLCAGVKMTVGRIAVQTAETMPTVAQRCKVVESEFDQLQAFTERMDLLFDRLPAAKELPLFALLTSLRDDFAKKFPLCQLDLEGPELAVNLKGGSLAKLALAELLANAAEAAGQSGHARLAWGQDAGGGLVFGVENTGAAIADSIPTNPPMPFFTTRGRHDGLGLAIVARVAAARGGRFEVVSNQENHVAVAFALPPEDIAHD